MLTVRCAGDGATVRWAGDGADDAMTGAGLVPGDWATDSSGCNAMRRCNNDNGLAVVTMVRLRRWAGWR